MAQLLETGAGSNQAISARASDSAHTWTRVVVGGSDTPTPQTLTANGGVIRGLGNDTKAYLSSFTTAGSEWNSEIEFDFRSNVGGLLIGCIVCANAGLTTGIQVALNGFSDQLTFTDVATSSPADDAVAWTESDHTIRMERRTNTLTIKQGVTTHAVIDVTGLGNRVGLYAYSETLETDFYAVNSFMVEDVTSDPPVNTVAPAVTGDPTEGETLSCSTGTWTNSPTGYTYQWQRRAV